jgi:hypothetical protein
MNIRQKQANAIVRVGARVRALHGENGPINWRDLQMCSEEALGGALDDPVEFTVSWLAGVVTFKSDRLSGILSQTD